MVPFTHLHVHSQYSILDGAASVNKLVTRAKEYDMKALALTDHGTMFGIKEFHATCKKNDIKPILGVETYFVNDITATIRNRHGNETKDNRNWHLILLAKNPTGYRNLLKLVSLANTEGIYYKPRIQRSWLEKHHEGIIASSACLGGEIPQYLMKGQMKEAEEAALWYKNLFGEDFYLELMFHPAEAKKEYDGVSIYQKQVNEDIIKLSKKTGIKMICTNDVHFADAEDAEAHDILICLNTGKDLDDENRMRYTRQEWLKTPEEMKQLWGHVPEAMANTMEVADKVEYFELDHAPIMPVFPIPEEFGTESAYRDKYDEPTLKEEFGEDRFTSLGGYDKVVRIKLESDYLEHLTYKGAEARYPDKLEEYRERIDFELNTIKTMGFPGYFLITQDFINAARDMGVLVGPGRGSAAGAAVSYCVGITNIDPIKHDLLFERFLNPDRISMPDVDIDFDDDGRQQVLDWVTDKYGIDKVAHICTFGTMATKSSIKDVARVLRLPLEESNRLAKMVPEAPKMSFKKAYKESPDLLKEKESTDPLIIKTLRLAESLEGSVRQTGVHACGILIGRDPLSNNIPLIPTKEEKLFTTQYDGRFVEDIGLLKMDFLGLKTLSIIKETLDNIKLSQGKTLDLDNIPGDDAATFELFSRGDTTAIFQFESPGMKKHLRNLQPNRFEDLVAMNALYRPGPMEYIPEYIERKFGRKKVEYDHPLMEMYLKDTYGITVFQEQVMLLSRRLGNFTRGQSDTLRKAMGKKVMALMEKLKVEFVKGCIGNPKFMEHCENEAQAKKLIEKIWKDWEAFASYAFNKSHSVCYAHIAYQTGYLKAHYPAEFMAGVLSRNLSDITKISTFMEECQHMKLAVKGPDVNESFKKFTVNKKGDLRFGMVGVKNVGAAAVEEIIREREANGPYADIYDFAERVNLSSVSKKNWEALAYAGGFDSMGIKTRSQLFAKLDNEESNFIENMVRYGSKYQLDKAEQQNSLFGMMGDENSIQIKKPDMPNTKPWSKIIELNEEKNLIGIYLSAHPLDEFKLEINSLFNVNLSEFSDLEAIKGKEFVTGGMVTGAREGMTKRGKPFGILKVEDYHGSFEFAFFGEDYLKYKSNFQTGYCLILRGRIQAHRFREGELDVNVSSIDLLSEAREKLFNKLTINMKLNDIDNAIVESLGDIIENKKGNKTLYFNIINPEDSHQIQLFSRKYRVEIDDALLKFLNDAPEIKYKVN